MTNETAEPMAMDAAALERETRQILSDYPHTRVEQSAGGWLIGLGWAGIEHVGHTAIDPNTSADPRDMARRLVVIATGEAPMGIDYAAPAQPAEDEDPGEQDLGAEMLAAEVEAGENPPHEPDAANDAGAAGASASDGLGDAPAGVADVAADGGDVLYPGIAILPDELGARRNAVLAAIATEKLTRLSIAMDPSRADFLAARFADYQNAGALGLPIDEALAADYRAFQELRDRRDRITNYAMQLEQSALDGDMDRLSAMHAGLGDGWP